VGPRPTGKPACVPARWRRPDAGTRLASSLARATPVFLEEREVGTRFRAARLRHARLLGTERLSHARRPVARGTLRRRACGPGCNQSVQEQLQEISIERTLRLFHPAPFVSLESHTQSLNAAQLAAAQHGDGPLLIIAGAGTGKTRTLVHRVAHLVATGVRPHRILLLTFTRRAAQEMLERAERLVGGTKGRVHGGTFHATAHRLLRAYGEADGIARKEERNLVDYDDLLLFWAGMLEGSAELATRIAGLYDHVLVDEYQDTNL